MVRKLLVVAAAIAMPVSVVAVTGGVAGAKTVVPPDPAVTCTVSGTVNFAAPGISQSGSVTTAKTTVTTTTGEEFGGSGCTGSAPDRTITSKTVKCDKHTAGQPSSNPACEPGQRGYDSVSNFAGSGTASIQKALKKLSFSVNSIAYLAKTSTVAEVLPGGACGSNEVGFQLTGTISAPKQDKGQNASLLACLGQATGTGLTGSPPMFLANLSNSNAVIATAAIDPATSSLSVS